MQLIPSSLLLVRKPGSMYVVIPSVLCILLYTFMQTVQNYVCIKLQMAHLILLAHHSAALTLSLTLATAATIRLAALSSHCIFTPQNTCWNPLCAQATHKSRSVGPWLFCRRPDSVIHTFLLHPHAALRFMLCLSRTVNKLSMCLFPSIPILISKNLTSTS